jgi:hypothetical protein
MCIAFLVNSGRAADKKQPGWPIKVFILAGDENVLEQGLANGRTEGVHQDFYPNAAAVKDEKQKHVNCAVYKGVNCPKASGSSFRWVIPCWPAPKNIHAGSLTRSLPSSIS